MLDPGSLSRQDSTVEGKEAQKGCGDLARGISSEQAGLRMLAAWPPGPHVQSLLDSGGDLQLGSEALSWDPGASLPGQARLQKCLLSHQER